MWLEGNPTTIVNVPARYAVRQYEFLSNPAQSVGGTPKTKNSVLARRSAVRCTARRSAYPPFGVRRCDLVRFPNSPALTPLSAASAKCKPPILPRIVSPLMVLPSGKLLHHDAVALDFVQIKLDRCGRLGRKEQMFGMQ